jgi:hypothetical protein
MGIVEGEVKQGGREGNTEIKGRNRKMTVGEKTVKGKTVREQT